MIYKNKKIYLVAILIFSVFLAGNISLAADFSGFIKKGDADKIKEQTGQVGDAGGYEIGGVDALSIVQVVINAFLSLVGVILLVYMLYAGYTWMTAHGEEEKVTKAKDTLKRAIIGAIIIIAAYAISDFVISKLEVGTLKGASTSATSLAQK